MGHHYQTQSRFAPYVRAVLVIATTGLLYAGCNYASAYLKNNVAERKEQKNARQTAILDGNIHYHQGSFSKSIDDVVNE